MLDEIVAAVTGAASDGSPSAPEDPPRALRFAARGVKLDESASFVLVHETSIQTEQLFGPGGAIRPDARASCFVEEKSELSLFYQRYNIHFKGRSGRYILGRLQLREGDEEYDDEPEYDDEEDGEENEDDDEEDPGDAKDARDTAASPVDSAVVLDLSIAGQSVANRFTAKPKASTIVTKIETPGPDEYTIRREDSYLDVPPGYVALYLHHRDSLRQPQTVFASLERQFAGVEQLMGQIKQCMFEQQKTISITGNGVRH